MLKHSLPSISWSPSMLRKIAVGVVVTGTFFIGSLSARSQTKVSPEDTETLTLDQAIRRAMTNEPAFVTALVEQQAQALEQTNARAALLPTATSHNQAIYTKPNGVLASRIGQTADAPAPVFIANNAVREYISQGVFDEKIGLSEFAVIRVADANAAKANAELEVARRGLVNTIVTLYYGMGSGLSKLKVAEEALAAADHFVEVTRQREAQREAAHADVLKAMLVQQQRQRDLVDARLAASKARLELGVLLYPNFDVQFTLAPSASPPNLPDRAAVSELAQKNNPELRSALASLQVSQAESQNARAALFPELILNFTYGIDATNYAANGLDGIRNLGYSMSAQLDIPVWNWLSTNRTIKQSRLRESTAKVTLSATQRKNAAAVQEHYEEAQGAYEQLASLDTSVTTARESLRLTELRYINGESTVLELVDAQSALTAAQNAQVDGLTRYQTALANLQTLIGTL